MASQNIENDLFEVERRIIQRVTDVANDKKYADNPLLKEFKFLLGQYKKLSRESEKIINIGDHLQKSLKETENQLKKSAKLIEYKAYHDSLTGLLNRQSFYDRLLLALAQAQRSKEMVAVMFLDLDDFKEVNDSLGHDIGDKLLQQTGKRLKSCVRRGDTVARLGGDEFTLVLPGINHIDNIRDIADKIIATFKTPFTIENHDIFITSSIGISIYPQDSDDSQKLLKKADKSMYFAKEKGKNNYQFYPVLFHGG
ncbi:MAG: hypothetical protein IEMM0008_0123 [bacterium]|nr:MAG: hypothetical protein IEMM0008_0123 [bacterium]